MPGTRLVIYGAGGHAKVVLDAARRAGWDVARVLDDAPRVGQILGVSVAAATPTEVAAVAGAGLRAIVGIGDNRARERIAAGLAAAGVEFATVVHPSAVVGESVVLEPGAFLAAGAIVNPDSRIGAHSIVNTGASVDHDCVVGPFVHLGPGVHLCGGVTVGIGTLVGVGACATPYVGIGEWAVVGAGAAVVGAVGPGEQVVGVPARARPRD